MEMRTAAFCLLLMLSGTDGPTIFAQSSINPPDAVPTNAASVASREKSSAVATWAEDAENGDAYYRDGNALLNLGQYNKAIEAFQKAIQLKPNAAVIHNDLGYCYFLAEQIELAVAAYREAIRLQPNYVSAYNNLGTAYVRLNNYAEAFLAFNKLNMLTR